MPRIVRLKRSYTKRTSSEAASTIADAMVRGHAPGSRNVRVRQDPPTPVKSPPGNLTRRHRRTDVRAIASVTVQDFAPAASGAQESLDPLPLPHA